MGVKGVGLKDHGDVSVFGRHIVNNAVANQNIPFGNFLQPRQHPQAG
jgi:hypothetical protein